MGVGVRVGDNEKEGGRGEKGETKNPKRGLPHCTLFKKVLFIPETEGSFFFISVLSGTIIVSACLLCLGI